MQTPELGLKFIRPLIRSGSWTYTIRQGVASGLRRQGGFGFIPRRRSPEERFLLGLDLEGWTVYDVGGYEGVFTLFFAKAVGPTGQVLTFEPNPVNCRRIRENLRLNRLTNVKLFALGLGAAKGSRQLVFGPNEPARGTINAAYQDSLRQKGETTCLEIHLDSLDGFLAANPRLSRPEFIKIDVEAAELEVLEGMARTLKTHQPRLFIEVHSGVDVNRLTQGLFQNGYRLHHVESSTAIDSTNTHMAEHGHLYCVPRDGRPQASS